MQPTFTNLWTQCVMRCTLLLCIGFLTLDGALAQTPGGVGSSLQIWHQSRATAIGSGYQSPLVNLVPAGLPGASNGNAIYQNVPGAAITQTYQVQGIPDARDINGHPVIRMDDEWFSSPLNINTINQLHVFMVYKPEVDGVKALWGNGGTVGMAGRQVTTEDLTDGSRTLPRTGYNHSSLRFIPDINHVNYDEIKDSIKVYINGEVRAELGILGGGTIETGGNFHPGLIIGMDSYQRTGPAPSYDLADFLVYSGPLTKLERYKITTHLGIEYGLPLHHDYVLSDDNIAWDWNHTGTSYNNNIIGVAYDYDNSPTGGSLKQYSSFSERDGDYLTISIADTVAFEAGGTRRSLVVGHNNSDPNDTPVGLNNTTHFFSDGQRIARVWRCEQRGGYDDYTFSIDRSIALPTDFVDNSVVLLVADNEDFTINVRAYRMPIGDANTTVITAKGVSLSNAAHSVQYVTLAKLETALWVKGDGIGNDINLTNGDVVYLKDQVHGVNDMFGRGVGNSSGTIVRNGDLPSLINSPTLGTVNNQMNFNPYVEFNIGSKHTFIERLRLQGLGQDESAIFAVVRRDLSNPVNGGGVDEAFFSYATLVEDNALVYDQPRNSRYWVMGINRTNSVSISDNLPSLIIHNRGNGAPDQLYVDQNFQSRGSFNLSRVIPPNGTFVVGQELDAINDVSRFDFTQELHGDLAELIVSSKRLTDTDVQKIRSYLSIKYGIFLETNFEYLLSNGVMTWSNTTNASYHKNIAGIGKDSAFQLNQLKSRSQRPVGDNVVLTIGTSSFSTNLSHMIWGASTTGGYDNFSTTGAPTGLTISGRHWKVQNHNSRVGPVTVELDIPSTATNLAGAQLIIDTDDDFSDATVFIPGSSSGGKLIFTGVNFGAVNYFTLGFETDFLYANNDQGAPGAFEACRFSDVSFRYVNLLEVPDRIQFVSKAGNGATVEVPNSAIAFTPEPDSTDTNGVTYYTGLMRFIIPDDAATGSVVFLSTTGNPLYTTPEPLIIHNPEIDFYTTRVPVCADEDVALTGAPRGGYFYSPADTTIIVDSSGTPVTYRFDGRKAGWGPTHENFRNVPVSYVYQAQYTTGDLCLAGDTITKQINVRDNRLNSISYVPQFVNTGNTPNIRLNLNVTQPRTILQTDPDLLSGSFMSDILFSGPNIRYNSSIMESELLMNSFTSTPTASQVYFQFNNMGCIASSYDDIDIFSLDNIAGLPSNRCRQADPVLFYRDNNNPSIQYSTNGPNERNRLDSVVVVPNVPGAVTMVSSTGTGIDTFAFDPRVFGSSVGSVTIRMYYSSGSVGGGGPRTLSAQTTGIVTLVDPQAVQIDTTIRTFYCLDNNPIALTSFPSYSSPTTAGYYRVEGDTGQGNFLLSTVTFSDSTLITAPHYNNILPSADQDLDVRIIYTVNQFGCVDSDTANTLFVAPITMAITSASPFCLNEPNGIIQANAVGSAVRPGVGFFDPIAPYMDSLGNFNAQLAGPGSYTVTYRIADQQYNCETTYDYDVLVRQPPQVQLLLDSTTNTSFCGSDTSILMSVIIDSIDLGQVDSIRYFGAGVFDSIFNPNIVFRNLNNGTSGSSILWTLTVDTFGCQDADTVDVRVIEPPRLSLDMAFNNRRVIRNLSNASLIPHAYCYNEDRFSVYTSPSHLDPTATGWSFRGDGIRVVGDSVYFNPNRTVSGEVSVVYYTYIDSIGCANTDSTFIQIDTIPNVQLDTLLAQYCVNYAAVQLVGTPDGSLGNSSRFSGTGLDAVTGLFDPSQASLGTQFLRYTFTTRQGCTAFDEDTIVVNALPQPDFGGLKQSRQYCTADPIDTLISLNPVVPPSSYTFWGPVMINSTGLWQPDTSRGANPDTIAVTQTIFYSYTDVKGCTDTISKSIFVNPTPELELIGLDSAYCSNSIGMVVTISYPAQVNGPGSGAYSVFLTAGNFLNINPSVANTGYNNFTLTYTSPVSGCSDTLRSRTYINDPNIPSFTELGQTTFDTFYCAVKDDTVALVGTPLGGTFIGTGIVSRDTSGNYGFLPSIAGNGRHLLTYSVQDTFPYTTGAGTTYDLVCRADTQVYVTVRPLPVARIIGPTDNSRFCSNEPPVLLEPIASIDSAIHVFTNDYNRIIPQRTYVRTDTVRVGGVVFTNDVFTTNYYFNPDSASAQTSFTDYTVTQVVTNVYGCTDTSNYTYSVNLYEPAYFKIDSVFCQGDAPVFLTGTPSSNGVFRQDGDTMRLDPRTGVITFYPMPDSLANGTYITTYDTLSYSYDNGVCSGDTSFIVRINPTPVVNFVNSNGLDTFCLGGGIVQLIPSITGGTFSGNGVPFGSSTFIPDNAGPGFHPITYSFIDSATICAGTDQRTFYVYGMPEVSYQVIGGCQLDSSLFAPMIGGLGNIFQNHMIDSITNVQWVLEPGVVLAGTFDTIQVDSIRYLYTTPGVYHTQLIVANQVHCIDTHDVRLVISPTISNYPYDQTFENGDGSWFAESRDASHSLLWEWGVDNNPSGIPADVANHIWATGLNQSYQISEDAWVYSPCFDMRRLTRPMISLDYWSDTRNRVDGTLLEYQKDDGSWAPLGELNRGINWFNEDFIAGQPGEAHLPPIGWAGQNTDWVNGRYKLDGYAGRDSILRLRMAFGSSQVPTTNYYDGFAFDNVWIGDRTRNVLLETTSNIGQPAMTNINAHVYNLVFHTPINKDVTMVQYHTESPNATDQFYLNMEDIADLRTFDYGSDEAGRAYIDGSFINFASALTDADFEVDMLQDPKFDIQIKNGLQYLAAQRTFVLNATVKALEDMPELNYRIYTMITEDSLTYQNSISYPDEIHAVVRKDDNNANLMRRSWTAGDTMNVTLVWDHTNDSYINHRAGRFQGLVFIQVKESTNQEVFQVATTRDVTRYQIGVDPTLPQVQTQFKELQNMTLFPNPANDYFNVRFEAPLSTDYEWKLMDIRGVTVQTGRVTAGTEEFQVDQLNYPTGTYVLVLYNKQVAGERKVILQRP